MHALAYVLTGMLGGMAMLSFFHEADPKSPLVPTVSYARAAPETDDSKPWTGEDLLEMASIYDQQADELQSSEAVQLEQRATALMLKAHMDPRGFIERA